MTILRSEVTFTYSLKKAHVILNCYGQEITEELIKRIKGIAKITPIENYKVPVSKD